MNWQLNPLTLLHWRQWDDQWALFDVGSGQTHQMDSLTAVTLMMIEEGAVGLPELALKVASEMLIPPNQELANALDGILEGLANTGLIEIAS